MNARTDTAKYRAKFQSLAAIALDICEQHMANVDICGYTVKSRECVKLRIVTKVRHAETSQDVTLMWSCPKEKIVERTRLELHRSQACNMTTRSPLLIILPSQYLPNDARRLGSHNGQLVSS
jgi:hypothetical protein